ncbi:MAG: hypothetical protein KC609_19215 [Myxococcales bacterium]|nr:hypothetical protein [Myxococcales bacterium]
MKRTAGLLVWSAIVALVIGAVGCDKLFPKKKKPKEPPKKVAPAPPPKKIEKTTLGKTATFGSFEVRVVKVESMFPVLDSDEGQRFLTRPTIAVHVALTNKAAKAVWYKPLHTKSDPKLEVPQLSTSDGQQFPRLEVSDKVRVIGRQLNKVQVDPAATIQDVYYYSSKNLPGTDLIWRAPGAVFSVDNAELEVGLPKISAKAKLPAPVSADESITVGKFKLEFGTPKIAYLKLQQSDEESKKVKKAWSNKPALVLPLKIHNLSDKTVVFKPRYTKSESKDKSLWLPNGQTVPVMSVRTLQQVVGRIGEKEEIEGGKTANDMLLFATPPEDATLLILHLGKGSFGGEGVLRVALNFKYKEPRKPVTK